MWRVFAVVSIFVAGVAGKPGHGGEYGSYETFNNGLQYNIVPAQPVVKEIKDYYSYPKYSFGYEVEDYYNKLSHGRWETRDGNTVIGQYRVLLPDGRIQIVSYVADEGGYRPHIQYINKGVHPPPPPAYAHIKVPQVLLEQPVQPVHIPSPHPVPVPISVAAGPHIPYGPEQGHHYGGNYGYDSLFLPSETVKRSRSPIARKRALLYDRTLFRRDIPKRNSTTASLKTRKE